MFPKAKVVGYPDDTTALLQVATGRATAAVVEDYILGEYSKSNPGKLKQAAFAKPLERPVRLLRRPARQHGAREVPEHVPLRRAEQRRPGDDLQGDGRSTPSANACLLRTRSSGGRAERRPATADRRAREHPSTPVSDESYDLLIVGGGPGRAGGGRARGCTHGLRVALVDERPTLGGQIYKQLGARIPRSPIPDGSGSDYAARAAR